MCVACSLSFGAVGCLLLVVSRLLLFVVRRFDVLFVVCCFACLYVVCCLLFVVCCCLFVVYLLSACCYLLFVVSVFVAGLRFAGCWSLVGSIVDSLPVVICYLLIVV